MRTLLILISTCYAPTIPIPDVPDCYIEEAREYFSGMTLAQWHDFSYHYKTFGPRNAVIASLEGSNIHEVAQHEDFMVWGDVGIGLRTAKLFRGVREINAQMNDHNWRSGLSAEIDTHNLELSDGNARQAYQRYRGGKEWRRYYKYGYQALAREYVGRIN